LNDFGIEIGTSFGPLRGKIWRIGTMGYVCRKENVLICLAALECCLRQHGYGPPAGAAVDAALAVYRGAEASRRRRDRFRVRAAGTGGASVALLQRPKLRKKRRKLVGRRSPKNVTVDVETGVN